ncbi:MAG: hypothetical protein WKF30_05010 [Pyrinomonadaceae bacterium]
MNIIIVQSLTFALLASSINYPLSAGNLNAEAKLQRYAEAVSGKLHPWARAAVPRIPDFGRRLVAIRGYLRSAQAIEAKWVWSPEEIGRFKVSAEHQEILAEVEKIKRRFGELNPGYTLSANTGVRSLDEQIKSWNETASIKRAGEALVADSLKELSAPNYKDEPDAAGLARFTRFLQYARLAQVPTLATPGLSPHGQLRALDFVVKRGDQVIAGTLSANIKNEWDDSGWGRKLNEAIKQSSNKFTGPLASPRRLGITPTFRRAQVARLTCS